MPEPVGSAFAITIEEEHPTTPPTAAAPGVVIHRRLVDETWPWWRQAVAYIAAGLRICRKDIWGLVALVGLFMAPPLFEIVIGNEPGKLAFWVAEALPWLTITLGNISAVLAIEALDRGERIESGKILPAALYWLPRYLVANGITTVIFWGIFTPLSFIIDAQLRQRGISTTFNTLFILIIPGLFLHVRLVFATYAAIVDDMPGPRSVAISFGIANGRSLMVVAAFIGSVLVMAPIALPAYILIQGITNPAVADGFTWVLVMSLRPLFIATLHEIYEDYRPATEIAARHERLRPTRWSWLHI